MNVGARWSPASSTSPSQVLLSMAGNLSRGFGDDVVPRDTPPIFLLVQVSHGRGGFGAERSCVEGSVFVIIYELKA